MSWKSTNNYWRGNISSILQTYRQMDTFDQSFISFAIYEPRFSLERIFSSWYDIPSFSVSEAGPPRPHWPLLLTPNVKTFPSDDMAQPWLLPSATLIILVPLRDVTSPLEKMRNWKQQWFLWILDLHVTMLNLKSIAAIVEEKNTAPKD